MTCGMMPMRRTNLAHSLSRIKDSDIFKNILMSNDLVREEREYCGYTIIQ